MIRASILPNSELVPHPDSRSTLYYHPKQPEKDWSLKCRIGAFAFIRAKGYKRLAIELKRNKSRFAGDEIIWVTSLSATREKTV